MEHLSLNRLLMHQTLISYEIKMYLKDEKYIPKQKDLLLLDGVQQCSEETQNACLRLKKEFISRL